MSALLRSAIRFWWATGLGGRPFLEGDSFVFRRSSVSCLSSEFLWMAFLKSRGPRLVFAGLWLFLVSFHVFFKFLKRCLMFSFLNTVWKCLKSLVYRKFGVELCLSSFRSGLAWFTITYDVYYLRTWLCSSLLHDNNTMLPPNLFLGELLKLFWVGYRFDSLPFSESVELLFIVLVNPPPLIPLFVFLRWLVSCCF